MRSPAGALYDALAAFEAPRRLRAAYPVHKRLRSGARGGEDIYDWVADRLDLRPTDRVLDAGCGVGFGALRLAERGVAHVTGITVSEREAALARGAAACATRGGDVEFVCSSFDDLRAGAFDVVVAVESLKHSNDVAATTRTLVAALAPGGRLAIVEDVFEGDAAASSARRVAAEWSLTALYREENYRAALGACRVVDLTASVRHRTATALAMKLAALNVVLALSRPSRAAALRAFRGGVHLEKLYAAGLMRYKAFFHTRERTEHG